LSLVVAEHLYTSRQSRRHALDEQPTGLGRVVQGDDVAAARAAEFHDHEPVARGQGRHHAGTLDGDSPRSREETGYEADRGNGRAE